MNMAGSIEMWLNRDAKAGRWNLLNARISNARHAQRMLFDPGLSITDGLHPIVAACLENALSRQFETAVLSNRDLVLDLGTLRLEGLRILVRWSQDASASACVRFLSSTGDRDAILSAELRPAPPPAVQVDTLVAPVLEDLLYPALEVFDHILRHGLSEENAKALAARVKTMRSKRDELSDYIALLAGVVAEGAQPPRHSRAPGSVQATDRLPSRCLSWTPDRGMARGQDSAILHGHATALEIKG